MKTKLTFGVLALLYVTAPNAGFYHSHHDAPDRPCKAEPVANRSVLCSCTVDYCDTVTRVPPTPTTYVVYTSSENGLRFNKTVNKLKRSGSKCTAETLILHLDTKYQTIEGFGGAVTDSTSMIWKSLPKPLQKHLINSYFSDKGIEYNMLRVPIGGTDFSTHLYAYNEYPVNDTKLTNYTLTEEDFKYKIPMIKASMKASNAAIHIVASTWSPPTWMKSNNAYTGWNHLLPQYYQTYADYHLKFLEKYAAEGVPIWALTTTNEPTNGHLGMCGGNVCLGFSAVDMGEWIQENLGPTIRNSKFRDTKILAGDDERYTVPYWLHVMVEQRPEVLKYIDGIAVHFYTDFITPAAILTEVSKMYPGKFIISTEACEGSRWFDEFRVDLGSWERAKDYILDIISDINHDVVGWIDWNMCLNTQGGPSWTKNFVDSPIIVLPSNQVFVKQPMFYAMGHFSKFVPRGSRRIKVSEACNWSSSISHVAFVTPKNTVVVVLYNDGKKKTVKIKLGARKALVEMPRSSVATVEFPIEGVTNDHLWHSDG